MYHRLTRAALLLAVMIVLQSIRLLVPVPPFVSMFVIGSGVNACLLLAVEKTGWRLALVLAVTAPTVAALQQFLPSPLFIFPVAAANIIYVGSYWMLLKINRWLAVGVAASLKMLGMYTAISLVIEMVNVPDKLAVGLKMMFGYPQWITGAIGGVLCYMIIKRLEGARQ
jgi:hypothetical protein